MALVEEGRKGGPVFQKIDSRRKTKTRPSTKVYAWSGMTAVVAQLDGTFDLLDEGGLFTEALADEISGCESWKSALAVLDKTFENASEWVVGYCPRCGMALPTGGFCWDHDTIGRER